MTDGAPDLVAVIGAADQEHGLFNGVRRLIVAVSGGPDSVALVDALRLYIDQRPADDVTDLSAQGTSEHAQASAHPGAPGTSEHATASADLSDPSTDAHVPDLAHPGDGDPATIELHVAHLDHGLRAGAVADAAFVAHLASSLGLPATIEARDAAAVAARSGEGIAGAARRTRYAFLAAVAQRVGATAVVTAHHRDDQAETVMLALLQGAGLDGLSGMSYDAPWPLTTAEVRAIEGANAVGDDLPRLVRPLLGIGRAEIEAWLRHRDLEFRDDPSNRDLDRLRNRLRHEIMPAMQSLNPRFNETLARMAAVLSEERQLVENVVDTAWREAATTADDGTAVSFDRAWWTTAPTAVRRRLVRRAAVRLGADLRAFGLEHVDAVVRLASAQNASRAVELPGGLRATVDANYLRIAKQGRGLPPPRLGGTPVPLTVPGVTALPGGWSIAVEERARHGPPSSDPWVADMDLDAVRGELTVRGRSAGDRIRPLGMGGSSRSLQDIFVDAKVPQAERDGWPLVVAADRILWVPGLRMDESTRVHEDTSRVLRVKARPPTRLRD